MKIIITGGIGSGKSYVCKLLTARGIEVYDCDAAAKRLMGTSSDLQRKLKELIGAEIFDGCKLNKPALAKFLLASECNADAINEIIHPAVAADFENSGIDWLESAIYFDSKFDKRIRADKVICVTAPIETRISRVMNRDGITREKTLEWIGRQLPQEEVLKRSDYEIVNDGSKDIDKQLNKIINDLNYQIS